MQQRLVDAGLGGDLLHAGAGGAAADEDGMRGVEDALLGVAVPACVWPGPGGRFSLIVSFN